MQSPYSFILLMVTKNKLRKFIFDLLISSNGRRIKFVKSIEFVYKKIMKLTKDIKIEIQKLFKQRSKDAIQLIQKQFADIKMSNRIIRCVIFLADGDLEKLEHFIDIAKTDYRDVIFMAEYTDHRSKHPKRIRDFNRSFGRHDLKSSD